VDAKTLYYVQDIIRDGFGSEKTRKSVKSYYIFMTIRKRIEHRLELDSWG
jgi:hypothetical protein